MLSNEFVILNLLKSFIQKIQIWYNFINNEFDDLIIQNQISHLMK